MRTVTYLAIAALIAPVAAPGAAVAQPERAAVEACARAVPYEVFEQYPQAYDVRLISRDTYPQGRTETSVLGQGEFRDRNGGSASFRYGCVYDGRSGRTYGLDVSDVRPLRDPGDKKDNSAAIAGLVLGAIIIGAIAASGDKDKHRDRDTWSPADGVRCSSRERACYEDGRYSRRWTNRIFVGR